MVRWADRGRGRGGGDASLLLRLRANLGVGDREPLGRIIRVDVVLRRARVGVRVRVTVAVTQRAPATTYRRLLRSKYDVVMHARREI